MTCRARLATSGHVRRRQTFAFTMTGGHLTRYRQGAAAEYAARDRPIEQGASLVIRSAGCHGPVDLVAVFPSRVLLVQVKTTARKNPAYADELDTLRGLVVPDNCDVELWCWLRGEREWVMIEP